MTDEIAFQLGKFDFPHFYQQAIWRLNKEPFPLFRFFDWRFPGGFGGTPCNYVDGECLPDWENMTIGGTLKTDEIKEIAHKLAYIRGRLQSYSVSIERNKISVHYANSHSFRDFMAQCLNDVIFDKFVLLPSEDGGMSRKFSDKRYKYSIIKSETHGTIPCTPCVILEADEEIIKYIVGE